MSASPTKQTPTSKPKPSQAQIVKANGREVRKGKIDAGKALTMRLVKLRSYQEIADHFNVAKSSVYKALKPFENLIKCPEQIEAYRANRAQILDSLEMKIIGAMAHGPTLKKATLNNLAYAAQNINNMSRLERGQSTANVHTLLSNAADLADKKDEP